MGKTWDASLRPRHVLLHVGNAQRGSDRNKNIVNDLGLSRPRNIYTSKLIHRYLNGRRLCDQACLRTQVDLQLPWPSPKPGQSPLERTQRRCLRAGRAPGRRKVPSVSLSHIGHRSKFSYDLFAWPPAMVLRHAWLQRLVSCDCQATARRLPGECLTRWCRVLYALESERQRARRRKRWNVKGCPRTKYSC